MPLHRENMIGRFRVQTMIGKITEMMNHRVDKCRLTAESIFPQRTFKLGEAPTAGAECESVLFIPQMGLKPRRLF